MNLKKNIKADLEKSKLLFIETGLVLALAAALLIIESTFDSEKISGNSQISEIEIEILPLQYQIDENIKFEKPKPKRAQAITIIEDDTKDEDSLQDYVFDFEPDTDENDIADIEQTEDDEDMIYIQVEKMPEFPGGMTGLRNYLKKNLYYSPVAVENDIQGRIFVNFIINKKGETEQIRLLNKIDPILDKEAVRLIREMPAWTPGYQNGKTVNVQYSLPISFVIE